MKGKLLGNRYELLEQVDSGGMAYIYKAMCKKTKAIVAVKILKEKFSSNVEYIDRFKKEAESVFSIEHKNVVRVTDIGHDEDVYYMVMEYVEGSTLKNKIEEKKQLEEEEAIRYTIQVCSALSAAHKKGIIHRDIKPQNILIDSNDNIKLTDFGIAKSIVSKEEQAKQVIGSVHYISPEQAKGEKVDNRTDVYSLGIMLYQMLAGVLPHTGGKTVAVALKHINEQITPPEKINADISKAANGIVMKATAKDKNNRYQTMEEFQEDLILALADPAGSFVSTSATQNTDILKPGTGKRNMIWKTAIIFMLTAIVASVVVVVFLVVGASASDKFRLPDLIGISLTDAVNKLDKLTVNTTYEPSESVTEGSVISQSPEAGSELASGESVTLTISSGSPEIVMPDITGMSLEDAKILIESMGLTLDEEDINYEYKQDISPGIVITQMPEDGTVLSVSDIINLTVSGENTENIGVMPQLTEKQIDQAVGLLFEAGFKNCFIYQEESDQQEGMVIRQSPEQGIQALYEDDVDLIISMYKNKDYSYDFIYTIDVPEKESKVKIVIQESVNGHDVNFVVKEDTIENAGPLDVNLTIGSISTGNKILKIYINNIETYSVEVVFIE